MIKIKKKIFFIIKAAFALVIFLTLVLFVYAAFFFDPSSIERKIVKNEIIIEEERLIEEEKIKGRRKINRRKNIKGRREAKVKGKN